MITFNIKVEVLNNVNLDLIKLIYSLEKPSNIQFVVFKFIFFEKYYKFYTKNSSPCFFDIPPI